MKKISTLFKKNPENLGRVINEIDPQNEWAIGQSIATQKFDGTAMAIIGGELYKRYDVKKGRSAPEGAIPCQEPDAISGHHPHWVTCSREAKEDRYAFEAFDQLAANNAATDSTYELCGPKVQSNPEQFEAHVLVKHGDAQLDIDTQTMTFDSLKQYLEEHNLEGIVFHATDGSGRMCKLRKADFGIKR